jgi:hypothetical protein
VNSLADENAAKERASADNKDAKEVSRSDRIKEAPSQVLSLLETAMEQTDQDGPCKLNVHEATLTLLFKGSYAKQRVLEEAMSTLSPARGRSGGRSFSGPGGFNPPVPVSPQNPFEVYSGLARDSDAVTKQLQADKDKLEAERQKLAAEIAAMKAPVDQQSKPPVEPKPAMAPADSK